MSNITLFQTYSQSTNQMLYLVRRLIMFFLTWLLGRSQVVVRVFIRRHWVMEDKIEIPSDTFGVRDILYAQVMKIKELNQEGKQD